MNERLKQARLSLEMKQGEFAKKLGLKQSSYSMMETGRSTLRENVIKSACFCFHINENWLRTGKGEMFDNDKDIKHIIETASKLSPQNQKYILSLAETMLADQSPNPENDT